MFSTKFISATREFTTYEKAVPAPYFRKTFTVDKPVENSSITICGLGFYELYINGKHITKGPLAPYISNPDDILYYDKYDLTADLRQGENTIGILLGNGILNCPGGFIWDFQLARFRSAPKVALDLTTKYSDNTSDTIEADESFKTHPSPILFDDLRCGETYDARLEIPGWNLPDFNDSAWAAAIPAETPRGETVLCAADPIVVEKELTPVSIRKGKVGKYNVQECLPVLPFDEEDSKGYIYDFGENNAGNIRLTIKGKPGQRLFIQFGELLDENGDMDMRGMHFQPIALDHRVVYYLKGNETEVYIPTFTYQGFRYCLVSGITEQQATPDLLSYLIMHSDLKKNGDFKCSNDVINKLQQATVISDFSNFFYFPTDCPHREKNGWTADAALSADQMLFNMTPENNYHEWMRNIRKAQREDGALPGIIPTSGWGFSWGNGPAWDSVIAVIPYYTWLQRGDTDLICENAGAIMKYLHYISTQRDNCGLVPIGLGDWVPIARSKPKAPLVVTNTLCTMNICQKASAMFNAVGMTAQKTFSDALFAELKQAARSHLLEADCVTVLGRCQTSQLMGIEFGLFENSEKPAAFAILLKFIEENNRKMDVGCLGIRLLFHTLAKFGHAQLAYDMIVAPEYPSYAHWILEENATSLFEAFQQQGKSPNSKNHHFFGDISAWFFKWLAGVKINPFARDVNELEISPAFVDGLDYAEGYENIPAGKVSVRWDRTENDEIRLHIEIPEACYGYLRLPDGYETVDTFRTAVCALESGDYTVKKVY